MDHASCHRDCRWRASAWLVARRSPPTPRRPRKPTPSDRDRSRLDSIPAGAEARTSAGPSLPDALLGVRALPRNFHRHLHARPDSSRRPSRSRSPATVPGDFTTRRHRQSTRSQSGVRRTAAGRAAAEAARNAEARRSAAKPPPASRGARGEPRRSLPPCRPRLACQRHSASDCARLRSCLHCDVKAAFRCRRSCSTTTGMLE